MAAAPPAKPKLSNVAFVSTSVAPGTDSASLYEMPGGGGIPRAPKAVEYDDVVSSSAGRSFAPEFMPEESSALLTPAMSVKDVAAQALSLVHAKHLSPAEVTRVTEDTVRWWRDHVNAGFLSYRKSMAAGDDGAALDWIDPYPGSALFKDARGRTYIDCLGGFGIFNVGRRHPVVVQAVEAQLAKQPLHSQELLDPLRSYAAHLLSKLTPGNGAISHFFFVNSGAEAVEAALKMSMLHTGRKHFVAAVNAFHGKTLGALAATSKSVFRKPFLGNLLDVSHVPFNDIAHLRETFKAAAFSGNEIAALILEPIQGEGGIHVASDEYLRTARQLCDEYGACLVFDEVQSGMGRSGKWFACDWANVVPDLIAMGKALGGGVMPVAACCGRAEIWKKYVENPFLLTTTFGGNPLALAATIATVNVIMNDDLLAAAQERGEQLTRGMRELQALYPDLITDVRGRGLLLGIEFNANEIGVAWSKALFTRFVLVSGTLVNAKVVRIEPPLTITASQCETVLQRMREACDEARAAIAAAPAARL
jgi:putrescine aminotransferase